MTMAAYAAAASAVGFLLRRRNFGEGMLVLSFAAGLFAFSWKWLLDSVVPMRGLGEVFCVMGMLAWPVAAYCRRKSGQDVGILDALWACALLFPARYVFAARSAVLPAALDSWYFGPHVAACLLGYVLIFKASVGACGTLISRGTGGEEKTTGLADRAEKFMPLLLPAAFAMTVGIVLGSLWGCDAWGDWWNWDPKEQLALASLCMLAAAIGFGRGRLKLSAAAVLAAGSLAIINLLWANLSKLFAGFHNYA